MSNADKNEVELIGGLADDAEVRYSQAGTPWARFTLACGSGSGEKKTTSWVKCKAFGDLAERLSGGRKGQRVRLSGRIVTGSYEDKKTGAKVYTTDVVAAELELVAGQPNKGPRFVGNKTPPPPEDPSIPF